MTDGDDILTKRNIPKPTPNSPQHEQLVELADQNTSSDSVSQDVNTFKKFISDLTGKVQKKVEPIAKQSVEKSKNALAKKSTEAPSDITASKKTEKTNDAITTSSTNAIDKVKSKFNFGTVKKLMGVVLGAMFIIIIGIVAIGLYTKLQKPQTAPTKVEPSPTPPTYQTFKPSVYAKDPEVLKIEENLDILNREMDTTNLKEDNLLPPKLDFDISFQ